MSKKIDLKTLNENKACFGSLFFFKKTENNIESNLTSLDILFPWAKVCVHVGRLELGRSQHLSAVSLTRAICHKCPLKQEDHWFGKRTTNWGPGKKSLLWRWRKWQDMNLHPTSSTKNQHQRHWLNISAMYDPYYACIFIFQIAICPMILFFCCKTSYLKQLKLKKYLVYFKTSLITMMFFICGKKR